MKRVLILAVLALAALSTVGAGCAKEAAPIPSDKPTYPGTEPYVPPTSPPPSSDTPYKPY